MGGDGRCLVDSVCISIASGRQAFSILKELVIGDALSTASACQSDTVSVRGVGIAGSQNRRFGLI